MKIYATDYDGTVTYRGVTPELKEAVRRWREAGNLFGIVTGRPRNSIRSALRANGLEVDFAVSDNGATASDGSWELIYNATLDPEDIAKRADLEDETVEEVRNILKAEFED